MRAPTWGDEVIVAMDAAATCRPGSRAWVVGMGQTDRDPVTIEFDDGSSVDIPLSLIKLVADESR
jgi:hypothetical protein